MSQNTSPHDQNEMKDNLLIPLEMSSTNEPIIGDKQKYTYESMSTAILIFIFISGSLSLIFIIMTCSSELEIYLKIIFPFLYFFY